MTLTSDHAAETASRPAFTVESAPYGDSHIGVCAVCGDRTRKMGSERKARAAISDHVRAKHPA